jgi:serine/threonine protein phosphatase PrpC
VADGHGDPKHDLSEIGAKFAVESATDILIKLADDVAKQKDVLLSRMVKDDFPRLVLRRWRDMVRDDFCNRVASSEADVTTEEDTTPFSRYGTTLIAAIVTETQVIYAQIGDGDIVLLREDASFEMLSPVDQNLVGGATFSLAGNEAIRHFLCGNSSVAGMRGLFLSTDGLRNSYDADSAFIRLLSAIAEMVDKEGIEVTKEVISEQFVEFSKNGSGDDITIAAIIVSSAQSEDESLNKEGKDTETTTTHNTKEKPDDTDDRNKR